MEAKQDHEQGEAWVLDGQSQQPQSQAPPATLFPLQLTIITQPHRSNVQLFVLYLTVWEEHPDAQSLVTIFDGVIQNKPELDHRLNRLIKTFCHDVEEEQEPVEASESKQAPDAQSPERRKTVHLYQFEMKYHPRFRLFLETLVTRKNLQFVEMDWIHDEAFKLLTREYPFVSEETLEKGIGSKRWQKLMPHQKEGVERAVSHGGRHFLADAPGLGKTMMAMAIMAFF